MTRQLPRRSGAHLAGPAVQLHGKIGAPGFSHGPLPFRVQHLHDGGADGAAALRLNAHAGQFPIVLRAPADIMGLHGQIGPFHIHSPCSAFHPTGDLFRIGA